MDAPRLERITIYPVKSCQGISLTAADVLQRGFRHDRRWVIADAEGNFISQRSHPQLAQISTRVADDTIVMEHPEFGNCTLDPGQTHAHADTYVWDDTITGKTGIQTADEWISEIFNQPLHFVYMDADARRTRYKTIGGEQTDFEVSFADGYPYLMTNQASLEDLNQRLRSPIPMDRFRPNLEVSGFSAFEEEEWKFIRIGELVFQVVKPCTRCVVVTQDQRTGEKSKEPLKTLASYRKHDGKVNFGMNLLALGEGVVQVGQTVEILENPNV